MKINLKKGRNAEVDDDDYEDLNQYSWRLSREDGYAMRTTTNKGIFKHEYMHRRVVDAPSGMVVDHINNNKLDNRKENLRICTAQQNQWNRVNFVATSKYKGVHKVKKPWIAKITCNEKVYQLGRFLTEEEAALAYNEKAKELFGEFAFLNKIGE